MTTMHEGSTTRVDTEMVEAWARRALGPADAMDRNAARLAEAQFLVRKAMGLEGLDHDAPSAAVQWGRDENLPLPLAFRSTP
jgi:hypothetical protein